MVGYASSRRYNQKPELAPDPVNYALGGLHQKRLKVAIVGRVCDGVSVYPSQWPPPSPPPRPEARVAVAGGVNVCWKQLCLQCSIIVSLSLARQSSAVSRSRTLVRSFVGSSSAASQKTPPLHVKGKSAGKAAARQTTHSPSPLHTTPPRPVNQSLPRLTRSRNHVSFRPRRS